MPLKPECGYRVHLKENFRDDSDPHPDRLFYRGYDMGFFVFVDSRAADADEYLFQADGIAYFETNPD